MRPKIFPAFSWHAWTPACTPSTGFTRKPGVCSSHATVCTLRRHIGQHSKGFWHKRKIVLQSMQKIWTSAKRRKNNRKENADACVSTANGATFPLKRKAFTIWSAVFICQQSTCSAAAKSNPPSVFLSTSIGAAREPSFCWKCSKQWPTVDGRSNQTRVPIGCLWGSYEIPIRFLSGPYRVTIKFLSGSYFLGGSYQVPMRFPWGS